MTSPGAHLVAFTNGAAARVRRPSGARVFPRLLLAVSVLAFASALAADPLPLVQVGTGSGAGVRVDGVLDEPVWSTCAQALPFAEASGAGPAKQQTRTLLFYDSTHLYIGFVCMEPHPERLKAFCKRPDSGVWRDDCVEVFLQPQSKTVFHIIVNSVGTVYDARDRNAEWDSKVQAAAHVGNGTWSIEMALAWSALGLRPKVGERWRANFCRERKVESELSAWSCTWGSFLKPERFGSLIFVKQPVRVERLDFTGFVPGANAAAIRVLLPPGIPSAALYSQNRLCAEFDGRPAAVEQRFFFPVGLSSTMVDFELRVGDAAFWRAVVPVRLNPRPELPALEAFVKSARARLETLPEKAPVRGDLERLIGTAESAAAAFRKTLVQSLQEKKPLDPDAYRRLNADMNSRKGALARALWPVWTKNNWVDVGRHELPPSADDVKAIERTRLVNEYETANLIITNLQDAPLRLRVTASDLTWEAPLSPDAANLVKNGGFEDDANRDGVPDGWFHATGNRKCWRLAEAPGKGRVVLLDRTRLHDEFTLRQNVKVEPGRKYVLQFWARTEGPDPGVRVILINKGWHRAPGAGFLPGDTDWRLVRVSITAPPEPPHLIVIWGRKGGDGRVWLDDIRLVPDGGSTVTFADSAPRLRVADWQALRGGGTRADPLLPLNPGGRLDVPAGESRQLWITFRAQDLPPGRYVGVIELRPLATADNPAPAGKSVRIVLRQEPLRLRTSPEFRVYNWDYAGSEAEVRDLFEHKVNVFLVSTYMPLPEFAPDGTPKGPMDFSRYDAALRLKLKYARRAGGELMFSYGIIRDFDRAVAKRYGWKFMDPAWVKAFTFAYTTWLNHLKTLGLRYDEFCVQVWDEATNENVKYVVEGGKLLRKLDPEVRLVMDGAQSLDEVQQMAPYIDVWIPHLPHLRSAPGGGRLLAWYKQCGKPVWTYTCRINMKAQPPYEYHRLKPWFAADLGLDGVCYWAYNSWRGDPWNDFDGPIADCGVIYPGAGEPVDSRRWEASREGIEDWQILRLVQELAQGLPTEERRRIEQDLQKRIRSVVAAPDAPDLAQSARLECIRLALDLAGRDPLRITDVRDTERDGELVVSFRTNRPARGDLLVRVRNERRWRPIVVPRGRDHRVSVDLPPAAHAEWIALMYDDRGRVAVARPPSRRAAGAER